jgi:hypothetical protein
MKITNTIMKQLCNNILGILGPGTVTACGLAGGYQRSKIRRNKLNPTIKTNSALVTEERIFIQTRRTHQFNITSGYHDSENQNA